MLLKYILIKIGAEIVSNSLNCVKITAEANELALSSGILDKASHVLGF